ncbi:hypothetical protein N658DRAFT_505451 [Parathielavia hyrcaniae]|uniref:Uncharacterized protein n=1 Tax=Parathielavia hyrcaniae TaxID=113614 RepID=A0AAN6Q761_9PEZI|nr:hypothetical protein N658DRAFT_505451 [Parathielavia hyrcaniae]
MRVTTILSVLSLMATAAFAAPADEALTDRSIEKRCPNSGSQVACEQACVSVVRRACSSCGGNPSCQSACERARYASCYSCCSSRCTTC